MVAETVYKGAAWFADNLAGQLLLLGAAALLGRLANRWFTVRKVDVMVNKKPAEGLDSANRPGAPSHTTQAQLSDEERLGDLAHLIWDCFDEVTAHLEVLTDKGREGTD